MQEGLCDFALRVVGSRGHSQSLWKFARIKVYLRINPHNSLLLFDGLIDETTFYTEAAPWADHLPDSVFPLYKLVPEYRFLS